MTKPKIKITTIRTGFRNDIRMRIVHLLIGKQALAFSTMRNCLDYLDWYYETKPTIYKEASGNWVLEHLVAGQMRAISYLSFDNCLGGLRSLSRLKRR